MAEFSLCYVRVMIDYSLDCRRCRQREKRDFLLNIIPTDITGDTCSKTLEVSRKCRQCRKCRRSRRLAHCLARGVTMGDLRLRPADDPPSLLALVLDADVDAWLPPRSDAVYLTAADVAAASAALQSAISQLLVFLNTFLLLHEANRVVALVYSRAGSVLAYPRLADPAAADPAAEDDLVAATGGAVKDRDTVLRELRDGLAAAVADSLGAQACAGNVRRPSRVSTSLATALCIINRRRMIKLAQPGVPEEIKQAAGGSAASLQVSGKRAALGGQARILVLSRSRDVPEQYVPVMNSIFAAQRMAVSIDTCLLLAEGHSTYFQQAAHLTRGIYLRPPGYDPTADGSLLQTLLTVFLPDALSRDFLAMPAQDEVDFRASCFATRKVIQDGYTCSVCLSTFDVSVGRKAYSCPTCKARFIAGAPRPPAGRRASANGAARWDDDS
jgi:transcription initiation factor TFIIH subunit 3